MVLNRSAADFTFIIVRTLFLRGRWPNKCPKDLLSAASCNISVKESSMT